MSQNKPISEKNSGVYTKKNKKKLPNEVAETTKKPPETTWSHLKELRRRLMVAVGVIILGFVICYIFKEPIFEVLTAPLTEILHSSNGNVNQMIFTGVAELFFTYLKLSFIGGFFLAMPIILWEIWRFVAPGLYSNEKSIALPFLVATPLLFYLGGAFTYFIVMPLAIEFFFQFQTANITALPSVKEYLNFFIKMVFAFGIAFELPVLLLILAKVGIVTAQGLANFRRYAVVCILVAAAVLTPPDPASQLMLALPLYLLYEFSILGIKWIRKYSQSA